MKKDEITFLLMSIHAKPFPGWFKANIETKTVFLPHLKPCFTLFLNILFL